MAAVLTVFGLLKWPVLLIGAVAVAGGLSWAASTLRAAGAAEAEIAGLARMSRHNAEVADKAREAAREARRAESYAQRVALEAVAAAERDRGRIRAAARASKAPSGACRLNDSIRKALDAWRAR